MPISLYLVNFPSPLSPSLRCRLLPPSEPKISFSRRLTHSHMEFFYPAIRCLYLAIHPHSPPYLPPITSTQWISYLLSRYPLSDYFALPRCSPVPPIDCVLWLIFVFFLCVLPLFCLNLSPLACPPRPLPRWGDPILLILYYELVCICVLFKFITGLIRLSLSACPAWGI